MTLRRRPNLLPPPPAVTGPALVALLACLPSCASPLAEQTSDGLTAAQAGSVAIVAVREAERDPALQLQVIDALPTRDGYTVSLQHKLTPTTARNWVVRVRSGQPAQVTPADPPRTAPETIEANPQPLRGNRRPSPQ